MPTDLLAMRRVGVLLLLLIAASVGGCKSLSDVREADALQRALRGYEAAVRWSDYAAMLSYHKKEDSEPVPLPEDYEDLRVMSYDVIYPPVMSSDATAQQMVEISYVNINHQVLRKVKDRQTWLYDKERKTWAVTSPVPLPGSAPRE